MYALTFDTVEDAFRAARLLNEHDVNRARSIVRVDSCHVVVEVSGFKDDVPGGSLEPGFMHVPPPRNPLDKP